MLIALAGSRFGSWLVKNFLSPIDPWLYRVSKGRFTTAGPPVIPHLVLTTTGRRSGAKRAVQLVYTDIDGTPYVVASNFGGENHPAWSYNLEANPRAEMQLGAKHSDVTAVPLTDLEKEAVWDRLVANIPMYANYKKRTDRNIKVYRLESGTGPEKRM